MPSMLLLLCSRMERKVFAINQITIFKQIVSTTTKQATKQIFHLTVSLRLSR